MYVYMHMSKKFVCAHSINATTNYIFYLFIKRNESYL